MAQTVNRDHMLIIKKEDPTVKKKKVLKELSVCFVQKEQPLLPQIEEIKIKDYISG